jgi:hypothetical protein
MQGRREMTFSKLSAISKTGFGCIHCIFLLEILGGLGLFGLDYFKTYKHHILRDNCLSDPLVIADHALVASFIL